MDKGYFAPNFDSHFGVLSQNRRKFRHPFRRSTGKLLNRCSNRTTLLPTYVT